MSDVVVTGANRGIGLELCRAYLRRGDTVFAACRRASSELEASGANVVENVDVVTPGGVARLREVVGTRHIDVLVNNAGIFKNESLEAMDYESIREQFEVNTLGPIRVIMGLLPCLGEGSKVAIVTSRMGSIQDNSSGAYYGYRMSKCAVNMAGVSFAHDLRSRGISVAILHPGFVRTELTQGAGHIDPDASAAGLIDRIDELTLKTSGSFWHYAGEVLPW